MMSVCTHIHFRMRPRDDDFRASVERGGIVRRLHKSGDAEPVQKPDQP